MNTNTIHKHITRLSWGRDENGLWVEYSFKSFRLGLILEPGSIDEFLLEHLGEDWETATGETDGKLCLSDALSLVVSIEQEKEIKRRVQGIVDPLIECIKRV